MKTNSCLSWRLRRLTLTVLLLGSVVFPLAQAQAGSLVIPAWAFDRGNARVCANPAEYADAGPIVVSEPKRPWGWTVEYEVDIPVEGKYTLQICYASAEARPLDVFVDDKPMGRICTGIAFGSAPFETPVIFTWNSSGATKTWEELNRRGEPVTLPITAGKHTVKLTRGGALPHLASLRLDSSQSFPKGWKQPVRTIKHIENIPPREQAAFLPPDAVNIAALRLALADTIKTYRSRYPGGEQYLKQLSELESKQKKDRPFRIYEIDIDPSTGLRASKALRQLTFAVDDEADIVQRNDLPGRCKSGGFDDMDPCYLPNGKILFASTRSMRNVFCTGSTVTTLYIMDGDGGNVRCISAGPINETAPAVLDDGRIIYTRWEYIDKGLGNGVSLWTIRPDGSGSDHVYKNNTVRPAGMSNARSIPGSDRIIAIGGTHHNTAIGPVVLVDTHRSRRGMEAMTCITPELGYPCMSWSTTQFGQFMDPYPFSEKFFLVAHRPGLKLQRGAEYGIYALDAWGNRAELCRDPEVSCYQPIPLRPRRTPMLIAPIEIANTQRKKPATLFMQDVYQGMTGIDRGRVKYLRVMGALPWPWCERGMNVVGKNVDVHRKKVYGVVKVHKDDSAYFTVPPDENIFFHALDENYMSLQQMPTFVNLVPGENRSCIGCHERRRNAPSMTAGRAEAMDYAPQALLPQPGETGPRMVPLSTNCLGHVALSLYRSPGLPFAAIRNENSNRAKKP